MKIKIKFGCLRRNIDNTGVAGKSTDKVKKDSVIVGDVKGSD